jgi:transposase
MNKMSEIKRLLDLNLSDRAIARALKVSRNTVAFVRNGEPSYEEASKPLLKEGWPLLVDWQKVNSEYQSGVTLFVLWEELKERKVLSVNYPSFWKHFKKRFPNIQKSMHRVFAPGSCIEIDYCDGIPFFDPVTGEILKTQLFVGVLCYSRYAFAEFSLTQKSHDFLSSHVRMFEFFGGVSQVVSPDNLKSAVIKAHKYDPDLNPSYTRMATYYNVGITPARVRAPKDKAIVERTIQIFQRWFYGHVRHHTFTSLTELNIVLNKYLTLFNVKIHRIFKRSRIEMFNYEREHLRPLPLNPYEVATYTKATLHPDCHLVLDKNYYSAPYTFRGQILDVWSTQKTVEIFFQANRVALHARSFTQGKFCTQKAHYPPSHQAYAETTPAYVRNLASKIGPHTEKFIQDLFIGETPLRHLRRAQGILRLGKIYGHELLEKACQKATELNQNTYAFIERLLKKGGNFQNKNNNQSIQRGENPFLRGDDILN